MKLSHAYPTTTAPISIGTFLKNIASNATYIVTPDGPSLLKLINIENGNLYCSSVKVSNIWNLSVEEVKDLISHNNMDNWEIVYRPRE